LVLLAGGVRLNSKHYRPDIDGLRAVAVVGVVAFHAYPFQVPGGFVGVDIFFVISGFLITSIITKEMEERTFSFATFYARRARRIFPALAVVLVTLLGAGWFFSLLTNTPPWASTLRQAPVLLGAQSRGWRWIAGALAAASLAYCFWLTPRNGYAAFFLPLARFWELMVGALLAHALFGGHANLLINTAVLREAASICGAVLVTVRLCEGISPAGSTR
jgi:peptidoglycan/LPS O-acetylase OafA/YrhL